MITREGYGRKIETEKEDAFLKWRPAFYLNCSATALYRGRTPFRQGSIRIDR